jgi:hypothetical protein
MEKPEEARARAEMNFKKEPRVQESETVRQKYEAEALAIRTKTARLRALRLAKEANKEKPER